MLRSSRRLLVCLIGAAVSLPAVFAFGPAAASAAPLSQAQAQQVGTDAYVYGIALLDFARQTKLDTSVTVPNQWGNAPVNQVGNQRVLTTPANQDKEIVGPSNSTLYSNAHLDLSKGPIVLHVPALPKHRYYAWEFLDPYTNVYHYVGSRTTGNGAGNFVDRGPALQGQAAGASACRPVRLQPDVAVRPHAGVRQERPARGAQDPGRLQGDPDDGLRTCRPGLQAAQAAQDRHRPHDPRDPERARLLRPARRRAGQVPRAGA